MAETPQIGIVLGSKSDLDKIKKAREVLDGYGAPYEVNVMSAHRTPKKVAAYAAGARKRGVKVIIAAAGLAAALPGVIAAHTTLPVIGLPVASGALQGQDALYAIVQMPPGIPVATVGIDNAANAAHLAVQILSLHDAGLVAKIDQVRADFGDDR